MSQHNAMLLRDVSLYGSSHLSFYPLDFLTEVNIKLFYLDQVRDRPQVRLPAVLSAARLPAQRGEEADQQRKQGAGDRLQRLEAHLLRLRVPGERGH